MNTTTEIRSLADYKVRCMTRPTDYAEFTERGFDEGWGMTHVSTHRDVGVLDESNWEVQTADLLARFPDSFYIQETSHWAVGYMEHLRVNMADEYAVDAAYEWYLKLEDYPVANEDDWSEREEKAFHEAWVDWGYDQFQYWAIDHEIAAVTEMDEDGMRVFLNEDDGRELRDRDELRDTIYHALRSHGSGDEIRMDRDGRSVVFDFDRWATDDADVLALRRRLDAASVAQANKDNPLVQQCLVCPCATAEEVEHFFSPRYEVARYIDCPMHGRVTVYLAKEA